MLKMQPEVTGETSDMARKKTSSKGAAQKPASRAAVRKLSTHKPSPAKSASKAHPPAKAQVQAKRPSKPVAAKVDQTKKIVAAKKVVPAAKPVPAKPQAKAVPAPAHKPVAAKPPMLPKAVAIKQAMAAAAGRQAQPQGARAMPATASKTGQKITAPAGGTSASTATTPAATAAAAAGPKKPVSQRHGFKTNEWIVYPAHGVGRIVGIEEQEIAGISLELFVITFEKDKMTLRVPTGKSASVGMRKLAEDNIVKRAMWSRRAQEYEAKINSGDLIAIAEVVRDLYRSESQPEQSYSERQLYEAALDRMAREIAAVEKLDERGAVQRITEVLSKSAKGRRAATEEATTEVKAA
jgi:CarD family transcriptional regulator, regulator of rRNA transcription